MSLTNKLSLLFEIVSILNWPIEDEKLLLVDILYLLIRVNTDILVAAETKEKMNTSGAGALNLSSSFYRRNDLTRERVKEYLWGR